MKDVDLNRDAHATASVSTAPSSTLSSYSISVGGLSLTNCTSSGIVSSRAYDALGRTIASTDGRGNAATVSYDAQGRVSWNEDALGNRTTLGYDALGRQIAVTNALGEATYTAYDAENQVVSTWGATYPVAYAYDDFGRMTAMNTFRDEAMQNGDTTTWLYDDATGLLTNKVYSDGKGPRYTYTPDGKLAARTWARGLTTTYAYTTSGQLVGLDYSDTTPDVAFTYDRLGRSTGVSLSPLPLGEGQGEGTTPYSVAYAYSLYGQLTNEVVSGNAALSRAYDTLGRSTGYALDEGGATPSRLAAVTYAYDTYGRFASVVAEGGGLPSASSFAYSYLPGSSLVSGMTPSTGHAWTRSYEPQRNLIASVQNTFGETVISRFDYENDEIGRRTAISRSGTAFDTSVRDAYGYNARSEVTSARRALADNPNQGVRGFSYDYAYDPIGNRITSTEYDHEDTARVSSYIANELNQYTQRTVPGFAGVRGSATNTATVTVNGNTAWRLGKYFYGGDDADNAASAIMKELDITAVVNPPGTNDADLVQSVTGKVYVAKSPEAFTYDDDGNMLSDGRFVYTWDGENRLASIETSATAALAGAPRVRVEYAYDHRSRRIEKLISNRENETWTVAESRVFLYDGWNMIAETIHHSSFTIHNSYVWGLDLSGSLQGAGGVGGLLAVVSPLPLGEGQGEGSTVYLPCYDANGNVMEYLSTDGTLVAHYEYSPFGETVIQSGDMADAFAFRFSTKYWENETKLYYYGYRFYVPESGRWLNRDRIGELSYCNLYCMVGNDAIGASDVLGMEKKGFHPLVLWIDRQMQLFEDEKFLGFNGCECEFREEKGVVEINTYAHYRITFTSDYTDVVDVLEKALSKVKYDVPGTKISLNMGQLIALAKKSNPDLQMPPDEADYKPISSEYQGTTSSSIVYAAWDAAEAPVGEAKHATRKVKAEHSGFCEELRKKRKYIGDPFPWSEEKAKEFEKKSEDYYLGGH